MATEGPPTLQSGVIPAWNYVPQLPGKVTPTSSPIVNAARKWKSNKKKIYHPKCAKHNQNASHPNGLKLWNIIKKRYILIAKHPCERMIHVCLGRISLLLQNASNSNVKSVTSTSKKCHLLDQNTMWTNDSCMFWYVLVTNLWGSDLHLNSIFPQRVPSEAKNEAKTRPENSFGTPSALAAVPPARQQVSIAGV